MMTCDNSVFLMNLDLTMNLMLINVNQNIISSTECQSHFNVIQRVIKTLSVELFRKVVLCKYRTIPLLLKVAVLPEEFQKESSAFNNTSPQI